MGPAGRPVGGFGRKEGASRAPQKLDPPPLLFFSLAAVGVGEGEREREKKNSSSPRHDAPLLSTRLIDAPGCFRRRSRRLFGPSRLQGDLSRREKGLERDGRANKGREKRLERQVCRTFVALSSSFAAAAAPLPALSSSSSPPSKNSSIKKKKKSSYPKKKQHQPPRRRPLLLGRGRPLLLLLAAPHDPRRAVLPQGGEGEVRGGQEGLRHFLGDHEGVQGAEVRKSFFFF